MGAPKPTCGYPSRTAAVVAFRQTGIPTKDIAARVGVSEGTVAALEASARRQRPKRPAEANGKTVLFPNDILDRLRPHAERRGTTQNELARRIVETVIDENMVNAVLDDEAGIC
ncbi:hypothetical protein [Palleronia sp.]|uniref:hypothetical protein n=1 Tax=Palleronia sp. TaxID=1940284 RepID=UPI0035C8219E